MDKEIIVALIAAGATVLTIVGSIVATKMTSNAQLQMQQIAEDREMKRAYYAKFVDAFTKKMFYINKPDCIEKVTAEMEFVLEANKLPMYASEEMILFIERIKNPKVARNTNIEDFLVILRNDLCENKKFKELESGTKLSFIVPNRVICTDNSGNKKIY